MDTSHLKQLQQFGLSEKEALVYQTLLQVGKSTASELSDVTKLNRSTTYVQLNSLLNAGLAASFKDKKKTFFSAESPENLEPLVDKKITELKKQKKQISDLLPELAQSFASHGVTPVVRHFQGKEGLLAMRNEVFSSQDDKIRMIMDYDNLSRVFSVDELRTYTNKRKQQTITSAIMYSLAEGDDFTPFTYQHLKRINSAKELFGCDVYIYGNTVSFAAMKSEVVGVSIDQKDIANMMKQLFDAYWDFHPSAQKAGRPRSKK